MARALEKWYMVGAFRKVAAHELNIPIIHSFFEGESQVAKDQLGTRQHNHYVNVNVVFKN